MQYTNYLAQIAALIRKNPSITVREIAAELKFADSKSVYYWLEKSDIHGINEFKRLVLGEERPYPDGYALKVNDQTQYVAKIPLLGWDGGQQVTAEWCFLYKDPHPENLFAVKVGTAQYEPWFKRADILIVKKSKAPQANDWVLLKNRAELNLGRVIEKQVINPASLEIYSEDLRVVGVILRQERHFSP